MRFLHGRLAPFIVSVILSVSALGCALASFGLTLFAAEAFGRSELLQGLLALLFLVLLFMILAGLVRWQHHDQINE